jgi:hypothetical protein
MSFQKIDDKDTIDLLAEIYVTMKHAGVFIKTREKMYSEGVKQYDDLLKKLRSILGVND